MIKILGSVLVMAACIGYSSYLLDKQKSHRNVLQTFIQILELLSNEIRYERITMAEAFCRMDRKYYGPAGEVMRQISDKLLEGKSENLEMAWKDTFVREQQVLMLKDEELDIMLDVGKNLGYLDAEAQVGHLKNCCIRLEKKLEEAQAELTEKKKVYGYLGVAVGLMVVLILI